MKKLILFFLVSSCANYPGEKEYSLVKNVFYTDAKDERQSGEIYVPKEKGTHPGVVVIHGGGWSSRDRSDMESIAESLAQHGFVVFNINYRLAPKFRHPAQVEDLTLALDYFRKNHEKYKLDPKRIGLWGYSSGGHTASYYALTNDTNTQKSVSAVVAGGAPHDFTWYPKSPYINKLTGVYRDENLPLYFEASTVTHVSEKAPPFFLYHAENDKLVEWAQSSSFQALLKSHGVEAKLHTVGFWGHTMAFILADEPVEKGIKFLKKKLR